MVGIKTTRQEVSVEKDLDKYFPNTPVVLNRIDGHTIVSIVKLWLLANITKDKKFLVVKSNKWRTNRYFNR
jgi:predicted amidohydrolase YtcJ